MDQREKPRSTEEYQQLIQERLTVLADTFGERDPRVHHVQNTVAEMTEGSPKPLNWHITACYAAWATKNPGQILESFPRTCNCSFQTTHTSGGQHEPITIGWVVTADPKGRSDVLRPCSKCNPDGFQYLYSERHVTVSAGQDEIPPLEEPPWDQDLNF